MKLKYIFLIALAFRLFIAPLAWHIDVFNHLDWGKRFFEYMPNGFYAPEANVWNFTWPNQPPGAMYIFATTYLVFQFLFNILLWINSTFSAFPSIIVTFAESHLYIILVKLPAIFADLGIAYLIYLFFRHPGRDPGSIHKARFAAVLFLFNPVVWYNSAVWGQTDATINFFVLLSFYLLFKRKLTFSVLAFAISLYIKLSLVIFAPIYLIYFLRKYNFKQIIKPVFVTFIFIFITTLPFLNKYTPDPFSFIQYVYLKKVLVDQMQVITANAFNFWGALTGLSLQSHDQIVLGLTYKVWGYILTSFAILPTIYSVYKKQDLNTVIWSLAIIAFSSFMLLTNMHERYIYPLFPYLTILVAQNRKLLVLYIAISIITLLNMYNLWWIPVITVLKSILENLTFLRALSLLNFVIFASFYLYWLGNIKKSKLDK